MTYNPVLGRWMEADPTGPEYVDGMNLYQADDSNPINHVDPTGTVAAIAIPGAGGAAKYQHFKNIPGGWDTTGKTAMIDDGPMYTTAYQTVSAGKKTTTIGETCYEQDYVKTQSATFIMRYPARELSSNVHGAGEALAYGGGATAVVGGGIAISPTGVGTVVGGSIATVGGVAALVGAAMIDGSSPNLWQRTGPDQEVQLTAWIDVPGTERPIGNARVVPKK